MEGTGAMSITNWENKNVDFDEDSHEFREMSYEAHNGNPQAQHGLGMWNQVRGRDEEARRWYKRAADQGHEGAEEALKDMKGICR